MLLGIDTSAGVGVAVLDTASSRSRPVGPSGAGGPRAAERYDERTSVHTEVLVPMIGAVLDAVGAAISEVTRVVVGTGPAPFTGLRVGLVTARTIADALGVPVVGVCSLDVLALQVLADEPSLDLAQPSDPADPSDPSATPTAAGRSLEFLVAADARRREVYWARYRPTAAGAAAGADDGAGVDADAGAAGRVRPERVDGPAVGSPATLRPGSAHRGTATVHGPGTRRYPDDLGPPRGPLAVSAAAMLRGVRDGLLTTTGTEPLYLRRPDVAEPAPSLG